MMARYYWSADGAFEIVEVKEIVLDNPCICYHCDTRISAGEVAAELKAWDGEIYVIHTKCAQRSVDR